MLRGKFTFDQAEHIYRVGDWIVPGITEVLKVSGDMDERFIPDEARNRGSAIHQITEDLDLGLYSVTEIAESPYLGWVEAYVNFYEAVRPEYDHIETPVINRELGFATAVDRAGALNDAQFVMNIKTGVKMRAHSIQLAAEVLALDGKRSDRKRFTLYIKKTKKWDLIEHANEGDFSQFEEALHEWREECHNPTIHGPRKLLQPLQKQLLSAPSSRRVRPSRRKK